MKPAFKPKGKGWVRYKIKVTVSEGQSQAFGGVVLVLSLRGGENGDDG